MIIDVPIDGVAAGINLMITGNNREKIFDYLTWGHQIPRSVNKKIDQLLTQMICVVLLT